MATRENRVILLSLVLFTVVAITVITVDPFGVALAEQPLVLFLLFTGLLVALPQLYLTVGERDGSPRVRLWFVALATCAFALMFLEDGRSPQNAAIQAITIGAFLGLLGYEYRLVAETDGTSHLGLRSAVIALIVVAHFLAGGTGGIESILLLAIAGAAFVWLVAYEFLVGVRSGSSADDDADSSEPSPH